LGADARILKIRFGPKRLKSEPTSEGDGQQQAPCDRQNNPSPGPPSTAGHSICARRVIVKIVGIIAAGISAERKPRH
jgi:hypothetical protein